MGLKFFLILCFGVLLQDAFGNLAQRSYNPRFRNVNKKYLKSAPEDQFGASDEGFMEEMYLLDTKTNQLTKTDVILVSMPMETTFLENEQVEQHPKPMKYSNKKKTHHQKLSQKPMSGEDSMVIHQVMPDNAAPIVLQLLGWSGNPPQPLVLPPMPTKNQVMMDLPKPEMESPSVPIVIKEEIMEEMKPVSMIPMDQGIVKPSEIIVEEIMMNEEPLTLVKPIAEDKMSNQAPEDKEKVTVVKNLEEVVTQADSLLEAISEAINEEKKPVPEMVQKEDKKADKTEEVISAAIIPEISMESKPMEDVKTQEIVEIMPVMVAAEKMPEPMLEASVPEMKKESSEAKIEKIASEEMKIQSFEPEMKKENSMEKMEEVQKMEEVMETSVPEMKKEEEPKIEKIGAEEMKIQSSEPEMKKESSMEKMEEVMETVPAVLEVASVDLSMKKEPTLDSQMPLETKLMDNVMTADESHGTPQVAILPQNEEMKISMEPKPMEADKKSEDPKPMMETMSKEAAIKAPIQKEIIKDLNIMIQQPHSAAVPVAAESKISEDKKVPCDKLKKEAETSMTEAAIKPESHPVNVEESLLEKKDVKPVQMDVMPVTSNAEKPKRKPKPSRKPRPSRRPRPSKKPSTTTESNESESESSSTTPKLSSSSTTSSPSSTTPAARIVPDLGS